MTSRHRVRTNSGPQENNGCHPECAAWRAEAVRLREALTRIADADVRYERDGHGFSHGLFGDSRHGFGWLGQAAPILQQYAREGLGRE